MNYSDYVAISKALDELKRSLIEKVDEMEKNLENEIIKVKKDERRNI